MLKLYKYTNLSTSTQYSIARGMGKLRKFVGCKNGTFFLPVPPIFISFTAATNPIYSNHFV
jgi:hypothetical protein